MERAANLTKDRMNSPGVSGAREGKHGDDRRPHDEGERVGRFVHVVLLRDYHAAIGKIIIKYNGTPQKRTPKTHALGMLVVASLQASVMGRRRSQTNLSNGGVAVEAPAISF